MELRELESAYVEFTAILRTDEFVPTSGGWPPELIGAHVAVNNDQIADATERIVRVEIPEYDNERAVDDAELRACATQVGNLVGVADEVERSARRLAKALQSLNAGTADHRLQVVIRDNGQVVQDGPIPIGAFIEGNAASSSCGLCWSASQPPIPQTSSTSTSWSC